MNDFRVLASNYSEEFRRRSDGYNFPEIEFLRSWARSEANPSPIITASMPICNQAPIIQEILKNFFQHTLVPTRLIITLDACTDDTESEVIEFMDTPERSFGFISDVIIFRTERDIFESSCDNFALSMTDTPYFLTIQADNFLNDKNFLHRAITAMDGFPKLAGISTRGVVPFDHPRRIPHKPSRIRQLLNAPSRIYPNVFQLTFLGPFISHVSFFGDVSTPPKNKLKFFSRAANTVYVGEAIVRGPILWRTEHLRLVNGFNDVAYFLGWDDYDICFRLFRDHKLRVGYLASSAFSLVNTGTNSFPRSPVTQLEYGKREAIAESHPGAISEYWDNREYKKIGLEANWMRWKLKND